MALFRLWVAIKQAVASCTVDAVRNFEMGYVTSQQQY